MTKDTNIKQIQKFFYITFIFSLGTFLIELCLSAFIKFSLYQEDGIVENLTAIIFLCSGIIGLFCFSQWPNKHPNRWIPLSIFAIGVLGFLDEISFGERIFRWKPAEFRGDPIDAIHDYLFFAYRLLIDSFTKKQLLSAAAIIILCTGMLCFRYFPKIKNTWLYIKMSPPLQFMSLAFLFIGIASVIDLEFLGHMDFIYAFEEIFELTAGWAIFCSAFAQIIEIKTIKIKSAQIS